VAKRVDARQERSTSTEPHVLRLMDMKRRDSCQVSRGARTTAGKKKVLNLAENRKSSIKKACLGDSTEGEVEHASLGGLNGTEGDQGTQKSHNNRLSTGRSQEG